MTDRVIFSEPTFGINESIALWTDGSSRVIDAGAERADLIEQIESGVVEAIELQIVAFKAVYPNANFYRFRDNDLAGFAKSFKDVPFLRDHDTRKVESRDGTVWDADLRTDRTFQQKVGITTRRGMLAYLEGQIDRFSIGWYYSAVTCSVCGENWFRCSHWPGQEYEVRDEKGKAQTVLCEIIFEQPRGKETSAVNAPAVDGTGILTQLCELKMEVNDTMSELNKQTGADEQPAQSDTAPVQEMSDWERFAAKQGLEMALSVSGLGEAAKEAVRSGLNGGFSPEDVEAAIERQRAVVAEIEAANVVQGHDQPLDSGRIGGMRNSLDQISEATLAMIEGRRPENASPLTGIRELYMLLSGDYEMTGKIMPENIGLANVNSSTMAGIVANALNKVVVNMFNMYPRWWEPIVTIRNFTTLQTAKWITLGGIGELPTVEEGAAYSEMTWDDQTEETSWSKKGGYLGLTLEAIDKDDTSRIMEAPRALAQAAWLTLGKSISAIFTSASGLGPDMSDSVALFDATHNNLGSTALSYAAWEATRTAMRKQTELNSGERLGVVAAPKFMLVPPDLEGTALTTLLSEGEPEVSTNNENPYAEGEGRTARLQAARRRIIVIDLWTDTNNWAAVADPMLYPSIGLGYRFGPTPEIFSVASPTSGLMFSNDVMPIKVRYFFAVGPTDWRGLYKHNVA